MAVGTWEGTILRAWVINNSWDYEGLNIEERPIPEPGPGEVILKIKAASLNFRDQLVVHRGYGRMTGELPLVPLSDGVGEISAIGSDVSKWSIGDRVCVCFNQLHVAGEFREEMMAGLVGGPFDGTASEYMIAKASGIVAAPTHLSDVEAATMGCAAITGWNAVSEVHSLKPGQTVVIQGSGGVSLFALQFAKLFGARVIATSSTDEKLARMRDLGADEVINYKDIPEWGKEVVRLTGGRGADLVVEIGGAKTMPQSIRAARANGTISAIGNVTGSVGEVNWPLLFMFKKKIAGISTGSTRDFEDMCRGVDATGMRPVVDDKVYDFDGVKEALQSITKGRHFGNIAIKF